MNTKNAFRLPLVRCCIVLISLVAPPVTALAASERALPAAVILDGKHLTFEQVASVARLGAKVEIADAARERVVRAHDVVLAAAQVDMPIYGLNRGVGAARQVAVLEGQKADVNAVRASSVAFNRSLLRSHSRATGPATPPAIMRAALVVRLNTALTGSAGMQPELVDMYAQMLNRDITPIAPSFASVGESDIFLLSYVGLAMMGLGDVTVGGVSMPADKALAQAGLKPVQPFAKDALAIMSSNAYSAGQAALLADDLKHLLAQSDLVFAASLEALNGNVAPLLADSVDARPFTGHQYTARRLSTLLQGSYLWNKDPSRFTQDALSFRTTPQLHGALHEQFEMLTKHLQIQLNASDDNPTVLVDVEPRQGVSEQEARYYVSTELAGKKVKGAVIPTAHFEPISWVLDLQAIGIGLSHLTNQSMQRANRLATKDFTGIELLDHQPPGSLAGYWKTANVIQTRVYADSLPMSVQVQPSAKDIEDVGTQAPFVVERLRGMTELAFNMLGLELAVADQVLTRRLEQQPELKISHATRALHVAVENGAKNVTLPLPGASIDVAYRVLRCASADMESSLGLPAICRNPQ